MQNILVEGITRPSHQQRAPQLAAMFLFPRTPLSHPTALSVLPAHVPFPQPSPYSHRRRLQTVECKRFSIVSRLIENRATVEMFRIIRFPSGRPFPLPNPRSKGYRFREGTTRDRAHG